ncbi:MAG: hypothetical protein LIP02_13950 [Bacteroidales bacterium]|nr:hypothetical protein [Bacteroidales bacterium]
MKRFYIPLAAATLLLAGAIPPTISAETVTTYTVNRYSKNAYATRAKNVPPSDATSRSAALSKFTAYDANGNETTFARLYTIQYGNPGTIWYCSEDFYDANGKKNSGVWKSFSTGKANLTSIAADEEGNIVFVSGTSSMGTTQAHEFTILPAGATSMTGAKTVTLGSSCKLYETSYCGSSPSKENSGRTGGDGNDLSSGFGYRFDNICADGNLLTGTGYIHFALSGTNTIVRVIIKKGALDCAIKYTGITTGLSGISKFGENTRIHTAFGKEGDAPTNKYYTIQMGGTSSVVYQTRINNWGLYSSSCIQLADGQPQPMSWLQWGPDFETTANYWIIRSVFPNGISSWTVNQGGFNIQFANWTDRSDLDNPSNYAEITGINTDSWKPASTNLGWTGAWLDYVVTGTVDNNNSSETKRWNVTVATYQPGYNAKFFKFAVKQKTGDKITTPTLSVNAITNSTDAPGRRDAVLTWNIPSGYSGAQATIQFKPSGGSWTTIVSDYTKGATTYTHTDATKAGSYRIMLSLSGKIDSDYASASYKPVEGFAYQGMVPWYGNGATSYTGYGKVYLEWEPASYGEKPDRYDIYRDGKCIAEDVSVCCYIDQNVPDGSHSYQIMSVYYSDIESKTIRGYLYDTRHYAASTAKTVTTSFDQAVEQYVIEEVYNYPIDSDWNTTTLKSFTNYNVFRQGVMYPTPVKDPSSGKTTSTPNYWYIYNRESCSNTDGSKDREYLNGGLDGGYDDKATGRIIRFDANAGSKEAMISSATVMTILDSKLKGLTLDANAGVGIACDEQGNFFIRKKTTTSRWDFANHGADEIYIFSHYQANANSYRNDVLYLRGTLDISGKLGEDIENRTDYFWASGKTYSNTDGHLFLAEEYSGNMYVVDFPTEKDRDNYTVTKCNTLSTSNGAEPFAFNIDGRSDYLHGIRSVGYYHVPSTLGGKDADLFTTASRVNNAGGITKLITNSKSTDASLKNTRQIFLVTPQCPYSKNVGNFIISVACHDNGSGGITPYIGKDEDLSVAKFEHDYLMPVVSFEQDVDATGDAYDANGNWYYIEEDTEAADGTSFYLYQYVPGVRFAKYHIHSSLELPGCEITYTPRIKYTPSSGTGSWTTTKSDGKDIQSIDGAVGWYPITTACQSADAAYWIYYYRLDYIDATTNNVIDTWYVTSGGDSHHNLSDLSISSSDTYPPKDNSGNSKLLTSKQGCWVDHNLDERNIMVRIQPVFRAAAPKTTLVYGPYTYATGSIDYEAQPVADQNVKIYKQWHDGKTDKNDNKDFWIYRVDVDFNSPAKNYSNSANVEPRSWYTVYYRTSDSDSWKVLPYQRYSNASLQSSSNARLRSTDEFVNNIDGQFDFDKQKAKAVADASGTSVVYAYVVADGIAYPTSTDPSTWQYKVDATYAGNAETTYFNTSITKVRSALATASSPSTTGVENLDTDIQVGATRYYTLQGIAVKNPQRGQILLEVHGDGSAHMIRY